MDNFWTSPMGALNAMKKKGTWEYAYDLHSGGRAIFLKIGCRGGRCLYLLTDTNPAKYPTDPGYFPTQWEVDCVKNRGRSHPTEKWYSIDKGTPGWQLKEAVCS